jgi:hypothetical protein
VTYVVTQNGLGYTPPETVWQTNFGTSAVPVRLQDSYGAAEGTEEAFSMGDDGIVIGARAAGRLVRIDLQMCFSIDTNTPLASIELELTGMGRRVISQVAGLQVKVLAGPHTHNHNMIDTGAVITLQVGADWVFAENDVVGVTVRQENDNGAGGVAIRIAQGPSGGGSYLTWMVAKVIG